MVRSAWLTFLLAVTALAGGCGSSGTTSTDPGVGPGSSASSATITVGTQSSTGQLAIYATEFVLRLPAGVSVTADAATGLVSAGVITPVDSRAIAGGKYTAATATSPSSLRVNIADSLGFTVGDLATIRCSVSSGTSIDTSQFSLEQFSAKDQTGAPLPGITPRFSVQTQ